MFNFSLTELNICSQVLEWLNVKSHKAEEHVRVFWSSDTQLRRSQSGWSLVQANSGRFHTSILVPQTSEGQLLYLAPPRCSSTADSSLVWSLKGKSDNEVIGGQTAKNKNTKKHRNYWHTKNRCCNGCMLSWRCLWNWTQLLQAGPSSVRTRSFHVCGHFTWPCWSLTAFL